MAGLVALAIILLAAVQVESHERKDVNDVRLNDLQGKIEELQHTLDERAKLRDQRLREFAELTARVHKLKESHCGPREFECTESANHCIHDILVCDGANDCPDGSDEAHCGNPAHAGATFKGVILNNHCQTDKHAKNMQIDVIGEKRFSDFPAISHLELLITLDDHQATYRGVYSYGRKALVSFGNDRSGLGMVCYFDTDDGKFCKAEFLSIVSKEVCGSAILTSD